MPIRGRFRFTSLVLRLGGFRSRATQLDPTHATWWYRRARLEIDAHRTDDALTSISRATQLDPTHTTVVPDDANHDPSIYRQHPIDTCFKPTQTMSVTLRVLQNQLLQAVEKNQLRPSDFKCSNAVRETSKVLTLWKLVILLEERREFSLAGTLLEQLNPTARDPSSEIAQKMLHLTIRVRDWANVRKYSLPPATLNNTRTT